MLGESGRDVVGYSYGERLGTNLIYPQAAAPEPKFRISENPADRGRLRLCDEALASVALHRQTLSETNPATCRVCAESKGRRMQRLPELNKS